VADSEALHRGEQFDGAAVGRYLAQALSLPEAPLEVTQFPQGASNLTYLLRMGAWEAVLRRPPLGPVAPKAHDMERECRLLERLHPAFPLAPKPYLLVSDPSLIGAPFYVMERRQGVVVDQVWPAAWEKAWGWSMMEATVNTLLSLHRVDYRAAGLADVGRPEGYLERQVQGWIGRYERAKTRELAVAPKLYTWLAEHLPVSPSPTIVHNDYKLNNLMFDPHDPSKITAVLDWEMTTIGDPLTDVGVLLAYWSEGEDRETLGPFVSVTAQSGFPRRDDLLQLYARKSGADVSQIGYYLAFSYFKIAVICQQIYFRWYNGQTRDERFGQLGQVAANLIERSYETALSM
jgi:aminoglycoside phosphotransferase (APT) family kinase protein